MPTEVLSPTSPTQPNPMCPNLGVQPGSVKPDSSLFDTCFCGGVWCLKIVKSEVK